MHSNLKRLLCRLSLPLALLPIAACSTSSPLARPVVVDKIQLDPLPASVTQIDLKLSDSWLEKESAYLKKVEDFSSNAPSK